MSEEIKSTTIRMKQHTIDQVNKLKECVHAASFSDMIRRSIDISETMVDTIRKGGKVIIEDKKGKQIQILITGLNK